MPNEKKSNKKLIEEKYKLIESLQKNIKGTTSDHPQTEEIMVIHAENDELKKEVMELKEKILQINREKYDLAKEGNELVSKGVVEVTTSISKPINTT